MSNCSNAPKKLSNDTKEFYDVMEEFSELQFYFETRQFQKMREHIQNIALKYLPETIIWCSINGNILVVSDILSYENARNFLITIVWKNLMLQFCEIY
ncbi:MAG: hypothetical protein ACI3XX_06780 [Eubacteriales bacterium]